MTASLGHDYRDIGVQLSQALDQPPVTGLYLPAPVADETFRDEFGFVFLADGSVGPFYVSMDDILQTLWARVPNHRAYRVDVDSLLTGFVDADAAERALAVGAYNALSAALMQRAGFVPPDRASGSGLSTLRPGMTVGMVGYFCPLVERLTEQGCSVLILERAAQRVDTRAGVAVTEDPGELGACAHVLCTAATLINDTLDAILAAVGGRAPVELIGPTGSGLPDPLFARGVTAVGGIAFGERASLVDALDQGASWGSAGRKYQLSAATYPGRARLIATIGR